MVCCECTRLFSLLTLLFCLVDYSDGRVEGVNKLLPVDEEQLNLAGRAACDSLYGGENNTKFQSCEKYLLNPNRGLADRTLKLSIVNQTEEEVTFTLRGANSPQLVILASKEKDSIIHYAIVKPSNEDEVGKISKGSLKYTFYATTLNERNGPSIWYRGPEVLPSNDIVIEYVTIHAPNFTHDCTKNNSTYNINATFTWDVNSVETSYEASITNICKKGDGPLFVMQSIELNEIREITIPHLMVEDDRCTFTIHDNDGKRYEMKYTTPSALNLTGCIARPKKVENIYIEASETDDTVWEVYVNWTQPEPRPEYYALALSADEVYQLKVNGITTEATFYGVEGEGIYDVSIVSVIGDQKVVTGSRAIFPARTQASPTWELAGGSWAAGLTAAAAAVAVWRRRRRRVDFPPKEDKSTKQYKAVESEDEWELRSGLTLHEVVGEGAFGVVRRGTLAEREVAVKMLKDFPTIEEIRSFHAEMELMKSVGAHPHLVSLLGCCSGRRPLIVAEYCGRGDLLSYLRCCWNVMVTKRIDLIKNTPHKRHSKIVVNKLYDIEGLDAEVSPLDLLSFCRQIAMGMEYLALNKVVHRDLAARNVLVTNDRTLKIADFGLSRDVYQDNQYKQKGNGKMPVKWMALESLTHRIYTTQSDVWSFGVVVWEVVTLGAAPYSDVPAPRLPRLLKDGYRMPPPHNCSKQLYELICSCWQARPRDRPTFSELHATLDEMLNGACADQYIDLNKLDIDCDPPAPPPVPTTYKYFRMFFKGNKSTKESYECPKAPQTNHYTTAPAPISKLTNLT